MCWLGDQELCVCACVCAGNCVCCVCAGPPQQLRWPLQRLPVPRPAVGCECLCGEEGIAGDRFLSCCNLSSCSGRCSACLRLGQLHCVCWGGR